MPHARGRFLLLRGPRGTVSWCAPCRHATAASGQRTHYREWPRHLSSRESPPAPLAMPSSPRIRHRRPVHVGGPSADPGGGRAQEGVGLARGPGARDGARRGASGTAASRLRSKKTGAGGGRTSGAGSDVRPQSARVKTYRIPALVVALSRPEAYAAPTSPSAPNGSSGGRSSDTMAPNHPPTPDRTAMYCLPSGPR